MTFRHDNTHTKHLFTSTQKAHQNDQTFRERPPSKFRIKSDLRGTNKMPSLGSMQLSTSNNLSKNIIFPSSKIPHKKHQPFRNQDSPAQLEETSSADYLFRSSKLISIDTPNDLRNQLSSNKNFQLKNTSIPVESTLKILNPLSTKQNSSNPLSNSAFSTRSRSDLKSRVSPQAKRFLNLKEPLLLKPSNTPNGRTNLNEDGIMPPLPERAESTSKLEQKMPYHTGTTLSFLPTLDPSRCSTKKSGVIKAYAANTNNGLVRNYNEDRVAIILNILKPLNIEFEGPWPTCSFFGIYDGHGGTECADFLRDCLHQLVIRDKNFPWNPVEALRNGFQEAERQFIEFAQKQPYGINRSGSCAIVALIVDDMCYIANVGDSRAIMSSDQGKRIQAMSRDHKPNDIDETQRIIQYGGRVYQTQISQPIKPGLMSIPGLNKTILGPHRVFPGRLSVSRTFGDIEAKLTKYGGIPGVVSAEPEIRSFRLRKEDDFIFLGCDGIFDKLTDRDVLNTIWDSTKIRSEDLHHQASVAVEDILREAMFQKSVDNVTGVMIVLSGFKRATFPKQTSITLDNKFEAGNNLNKRISTEVYQEKEKSFNEINQGSHNSVKKSWDEAKLMENTLSDRSEHSRHLFSASLKKAEKKVNTGSSFNDYGIQESSKRPGVTYKRFGQP